MPIAWHAPYEMLKPETRDMSRAIHSLMEELEAMDWYSQRVDVTDDQALAAILKHHAEEEKEHAVMLIEWIRRRDPEWDAHLRTYLFTTADILEIEESAPDGSSGQSAEPFETGPPPPAAHAQSLRDEIDLEMPREFTVGSLRPRGTF